MNLQLPKKNPFNIVQLAFCIEMLSKLNGFRIYEPINGPLSKIYRS